MREVELKGVVDDLSLRCQRLEAAGARMTFTGQLEDRRYDNASSALKSNDLVLRLRTYRTPTTVAAHLDWKGPTERVDGFKVREELTTTVGDPAALATILEALGYHVIQHIDRDIVQYDFQGTMIRFERYPRMDTLVEVEGPPDGIEHAIQAIGLPRNGFTANRLADFVQAYEMRTGMKAATDERSLQSDHSPSEKRSNTKPDTRRAAGGNR